MFSVVITHFNRPDSLLRCLYAIDVSSRLVDEIIVVDNGSCERNFNEAEKAVRNVTKAKFISHPVGNANAARNAGFKLASSKWICFCDDDDYFSEDKFSVLAKIITANPNVQVVYNALKVEWFGTSFGYVTNPSAPSIKMNYRDFVFNRLGSTSGLTIEKDLLQSVGGFDERLNSLQDYELYIRLALNEASLWLTNRPLTFYYKGLSSGQVSSGVDRLKESLIYIEKKHSFLVSSDVADIYSAWKERLIFQKEVDSGIKLHKIFTYRRVGLRYKLVCYGRRSLMRVVRCFIQ